MVISTHPWALRVPGKPEWQEQWKGSRVVVAAGRVHRLYRVMKSRVEVVS